MGHSTLQAVTDDNGAAEWGLEQRGLLLAEGSSVSK